MSLHNDEQADNTPKTDKNNTNLLFVLFVAVLGGLLGSYGFKEYEKRTTPPKPELKIAVIDTMGLMLDKRLREEEKEASFISIRNAIADLSNKGYLVLKAESLLKTPQKYIVPFEAIFRSEKQTESSEQAK